jgi:peptide/nickel transport system substrate-binding protein
MFRNYWQAVGLRVILNDAPATEISLRAAQGLNMMRMGHMSEMDLWTYPDLVFPTGTSFRAWPLQALWYNTGGAQGEEPGEIAQRLYSLYVEGLNIPDPEDRHHLVWEAIGIHLEEGPFYIGSAAGLPMPAVARENLRNIPNFGILGPWAVGAPGNTDPWQYFFKQP